LIENIRIGMSSVLVYCIFRQCVTLALQRFRCARVCICA